MSGFRRLCRDQLLMIESSQYDAEQVMHGEDFVGGEVQITIHVTLGDDVNGRDIRLDDFHGAGKVVF